MTSSNVIAMPAPPIAEDPVFELIKLFKGAAAAENAAIDGFYAVEMSKDKAAKALGDRLVGGTTDSRILIMDKICSTKPTTIAGIAAMAQAVAKGASEEQMPAALKSIAAACRALRSGS